MQRSNGIKENNWGYVIEVCKVKNWSLPKYINTLIEEDREIIEQQFTRLMEKEVKRDQRESGIEVLQDYKE